jgi:hypothetical protein
MAGYTVSNVTSGKYARQVSVAASGPQGAAGPTGATGPVGPQGSAGGLSARYKFLNSYSTANPGGGYFAFNNSTFMSATELYMSGTDAATDAQAALLATIIGSTNGYKAVLTFQKVSDPRKSSRFYVTGGSNNSGWWDFQIEYIGGTVLSWTYNEQVDVLVTPIGNTGEVGPTGPTGPAGLGLPSGGTTGQILRKSSNSNYTTEWVDPASVQEVALNQLIDVNLDALTDGYVLIYDEDSNTWIPVSPASLPQSTGTLSGIIEGGSASSSF